MNAKTGSSEERMKLHFVCYVYERLWMCSFMLNASSVEDEEVKFVPYNYPGKQCCWLCMNDGIIYLATVIRILF